MCTGRGSNQGPLGPKSDAFTTAPLRHLMCALDVFQNVIQQMLAVQPELLADHTVPPASQFTIDNLSTVSLTMDHIGRFIIL